MECVNQRRLSRIAPAACLALAALLAVSTTPAAGTAEQPKSHAAMPAPIPADALEKMPQDATGYCGDGTWSTAATKQGACSSHGGVKVWFGPAPHGTTGRCKDGTYTQARKGTPGTCSGHGGVKSWASQAAAPATPKTD